MFLTSFGHVAVYVSVLTLTENLFHLWKFHYINKDQILCKAHISYSQIKISIKQIKDSLLELALQYRRESFGNEYFYFIFKVSKSFFRCQVYLEHFCLLWTYNSVEICKNKTNNERERERQRCTKQRRCWTNYQTRPFLKAGKAQALGHQLLKEISSHDYMIS